MQKIEMTLTIFFEDPFWVGVFERKQFNQLEICKITFGSQPKDCEVYNLILEHWNMLRFSEKTKVSKKTKVVKNPKRQQRLISKQLQDHGISTKSQEALNKQHESDKDIRKISKHLENNKKKQELFSKKQQKRKEKHKGH